MRFQSPRGELDHDSDVAEEVELTDEIVTTYGLEEWAEKFSLMTAGYRDLIDPANSANPKFPFNTVTVALMAEAKGRVLSRKRGTSGPGDVVVGGEVRAHTQTFIRIAARVYAAQGYRVHLRHDVQTSPIWYSSFGVFFEEFQSGDNFTASHSPYYKQGWKVLDSEGKEIVEEEEEIIHEIRCLVASRATIHLAPWVSSGRIFSDLDVDEAYTRYQRATLGDEVFTTIAKAAKNGFRCFATPLGGSMGQTSKRILRRLGIENAVSFFLDEEDSRFHRVGEYDEGHNYGADVGKSEVCKRTGAPTMLLNGEADLILLWDPDGDRLNIMSTAPIELKDKAKEFGLKVGESNDRRMVIYLTPNQIYLLIIHYRIQLLRRLGQLDQYNWFVVTTFPSAMAIEELALKNGLPTIRVPVGFRNLGGMCRVIEENSGKDQTITTMTGREIKLGPTPRVLLLCEESGGASLGGPNPLQSRSGKQTMLAHREKDGLQLSLPAWALAASLHESGVSIAEQYCQILSENKIQYIYGKREDVSLYDEGLKDEAFERARAEGIRKRDRVVPFFRDIATAFAEHTRSESEVRELLRNANPSAADNALSVIREAAWIGDGTLFEMDGARLIVRASGTDALMRYYMEAISRERLSALTDFVKGLNL